MRYRIGLAGLPLSIIKGATHSVVTLVSNGYAGIPEFPCIGLLGMIVQDADDLGLLDLIKGLTAKLEIIPLLVDGERAVADDIDTLLYILDHIVHAEWVLTGAERYIGHALELHIRPAL